MRFNRKIVAGIISVLTVLSCAGCSGIRARGTVSPATFLLPGLMQVRPESSCPPNSQDPTGAPLAVTALCS